MDREHEFKEYLDHFPAGISADIENYAIKEVFKSSRYIFTWRQSKHQHGYCTHCRREFETKDVFKPYHIRSLKHNADAVCPHCKSLCTVKASGISRKKLIDEAYFVYYEKSVINPNAIIARGFYAVRDYSQLYWDVKTKYLEMAYYIFEPGQSTMLERGGFYGSGALHSFKLQKRSSVFSMYGQPSMANQNVRVACSRESIKKAVTGTPFRFSTWESYKMDDMVKFFDLYTKYPCIEYLTKLGFGDLVKEKLDGMRTYSAVNWRGKNLFSVLRITKQELNSIKAQHIYVTYKFLKILQMSKKDGSNFTPAEAAEVADNYYLEELQKVLVYGSLRKITGYIGKQRFKYTKHFHSQNGALMTWRDYIKDCIKLEMDLSKERVLFPRNLHRSHQNTIRQIKIKADEALNKKIRDRVKTLHRHYYFEHQGLLIRPAASTNELIDEGKALNHCVGTYSKRYADGENVLLLIRKLSEPDKPYYTMEIKGSTVIQVRGFENCNPDEQVEEFVKSFKAEKLEIKKVKSKIKIPA